MNPKLAEVLDTIIQKMESGKLNWSMPWIANEAPHNYKTKRMYSGFNLFMLMYSGYGKSGWLTFNQVKEMGGFVKKGSKATPIVFWKPTQYEKINSDGVKETKNGLIMRLYHVFNQEQIEGIEFVDAPEREMIDINFAHDMVKKMGVDLGDSKRDRACYIPSLDRIEMPKQKQFKSDEAYLATLFHEMTHSTGHSTRLNREMKGRFDKDSYSFEELIAELGASFLCAMNGVVNDMEQSAAYMQHWANVIKADKMMLYKAAGMAQKAVDFIMNVNAPVEDETEVVTEIETE